MKVNFLIISEYLFILFISFKEYIISIISSLMKYCSAANKQRVLQKFVENDHEKVDRLIEIYFKYLEKVNQVDEMIKKEKEEVNL
jgi:beta-catenin-like protein 1